MPDPSPRIGILRERPLHASLKHWYAQAGDRFEVPVDGYVIDLVRGDLLIEIQTRGFAPMKRKVTDLLARGHPVRIVRSGSSTRSRSTRGSSGSTPTARPSRDAGRPGTAVPVTWSPAW